MFNDITLFEFSLEEVKHLVSHLLSLVPSDKIFWRNVLAFTLLDDKVLGNAVNCEFICYIFVSYGCKERNNIVHNKWEWNTLRFEIIDFLINLCLVECSDFELNLVACAKLIFDVC